MQSSSQGILQRIRELLITNYKEFLSIQRVLVEENYSLHDCYINLTVIKEESEKEQKTTQDRERENSKQSGDKAFRGDM
jgi:hypothetical protein